MNAANPTDAYSTVRVSLTKNIATLTLNRPQTRNAVSQRMLEEIISVCDWLRTTSDIHFLIVDHEGSVFSSGADLKEAVQIYSDPATAPSKVRIKQQLAQEALTKLANTEQISLAAIRGSAYGAGVGIAISCDIKVMADDAIFSLPESKLGMFLSYGILPRLVAQVGPTKTKLMTLVSEDWSASRCLEAGIVDSVVPSDQVLSKITETIKTLEDREWDALRINKKIINELAMGAASGSYLSTIEPDLAAFSYTRSTPRRL